ncbi:hypothetical protein HY490_02305 [Candidatus Woesearchaeota archaeon]|nr:hypothetical protein [Candidatus Woesearchaeota archaeon]
MLSRREFLAAGAAGLAYALSPPEALAAPDPTFTLTREQFNEFLRRPVSESLSETRVEMVEWDVYDTTVAQSHLPARERKPVVSLIHSEHAGSRGLAALVYTFDKRYSNLKVLAVSYSDSSTPSQSEIDTAFRRCPLRSLPGLIFYTSSAGSVARLDQMDGGVQEFEGRGSYRRNVEILCPFIEGQLLTSR